MMLPDQPSEFADGYFLPPDRAPELPTMTVEEKAVRDLFVTEYLVDYNATQACMRCGFQFQFAIEYAKQFMQDPYVQKRISDLRTSGTVDQEKLDDYNKRRVREQLLAEAFYHGPGASHAARVAALGRLTQVYRMGEEGKNGPGGKAQGGVMAVPGIADIDEWEKTASESQDALVKHAAPEQ